MRLVEVLEGCRQLRQPRPSLTQVHSRSLATRQSPDAVRPATRRRHQTCGDRGRLSSHHHVRDRPRTCEHASPIVRQTSLHWSSPGNNGERASHFFLGGVLHGFSEDLVLQGFPPEDTLELGDFRTGRRQLGRLHHRLAGADLRSTGWPRCFPVGPRGTRSCPVRRCAAFSGRDRRLRRWSFKTTSTGSVCLVVLIALFLSQR